MTAAAILAWRDEHGGFTAVEELLEVDGIGDATLATIEGVAPEGTLHPLQRCFIEHDALQCGYCTPGQIMSALGLIAEGRLGNDVEIAEQMSGNLCRCGAYPNIVAAIAEATRS